MEALSQSHRRPDLYLVAAMDDPAIPGVVERAASPAAPRRRDPRRAGPRPLGGGLPLARSRNAAAAAAIATGANLLVFLDVDCLPSPQLVGRYAEAAATVRQRDSGGRRPTVLAGTVHYLPPRRPGRSGTRRRTSRATGRIPLDRRPAPDEVWAADDPLLFWSLSFAITAQDWLTLGGFDEDYEGYGGEDTDFAMRLTAHDGRLLWVGARRATTSTTTSRTRRSDTSRTSWTTATGSTRGGGSSPWADGSRPSPTTASSDGPARLPGGT